MDKEKRDEIKRLSADAYNKKCRYEMLGMMNTPICPEEREAAAVEYALAQRELIEANWALKDALNSRMG